MKTRNPLPQMPLSPEDYIATHHSKATVAVGADAERLITTHDYITEKITNGAGWMFRHLDGFGHRVAALYQAVTGRQPIKGDHVLDGRERRVNTYLEHTDRFILDLAWREQQIAAEVQEVLHAAETITRAEQ